MCGSLTEQCYCAAPLAWEPAWQQHENNSNNNLAADNYIRQFEEAYTASYSGLDVKFSSKPADCSYHNLSPSYYPQISPTDKQQQQQQQHQQHQQYMMASEETQSHQPPASQPLYHSNYVADLAPDYIQPYHIFQVTSLRSQLSEADSVTLFRWTSQSVTAEVNRSTILHISVQAGPRSTSLHQSASLVSTETGSQTGRPSTVSTTSSRNVASVCPRRVTVATNKPVTSVHSTTHHFFWFLVRKVYAGSLT